MTYAPSLASPGSSRSPSALRLASANSRSPLASSPNSSPDCAGDELAELGSLLLQLEDAIDGAFALSGRFAAALTDARRARNLSAVVGQPVFDRAARAMNGLGSARGEIVGAHRGLQALAKQLGIRVTDYGDGQDKPPMGLDEDAGAQAMVA